MCMTCPVRYLVLTVQSPSTPVLARYEAWLMLSCIQAVFLQPLQKYTFRKSVRNAFHSATTFTAVLIVLWQDQSSSELRIHLGTVPTEASVNAFFIVCTAAAASCPRCSITECFQGGHKMALAFISPGSWCMKNLCWRFQLWFHWIKMQFKCCSFCLVWSGLPVTTDWYGWWHWLASTSGLTTMPSVLPGRVS